MVAFPGPLGFRRYASYALGAFALASAANLAMISLGACDSPVRKISIVKEVLLVPGNAATPHVIVRTPDGGFIVAGSILIDTSEQKVWATRVTSSGAIVWSYGLRNEADDDFRGRKGTLIGALMLPDNSTLLCGSAGPRRPGNELTGYLVRVEASGKVLSELNLHPNGDAHFGYSLLTRCLPWGDGFALVGGLSHDQQTQGWLIKLNSQGIQEWEKVGADVGGEDAVETTDHDLVTIEGGVPRSFYSTVRRLDINGELIAKREIESVRTSLLRSLGASANAYCVTHKFRSGEVRVLTLDRGLRDASPERLINTVALDFRDGRGFVFPDQSLAIFGHSESSGTAAIAYVGSNSKQVAVYNSSRNDGSAFVDDAVVLQSATDFASIRQLIVSQEKRGIVLSWVSFR